jgi:hypothetical protein
MEGEGILPDLSLQQALPQGIHVEGIVLVA